MYTTNGQQAPRRGADTRNSFGTAAQRSDDYETIYTHTCVHTL